jgi:DNA-binding beta-propeller fold protein YncE
MRFLMRKIGVRITVRLIAVIAALSAFALLPSLALARTPGALTQFDSPNNCIESTSSESTECPTQAPGLSGTEGVAVSPNGQNVYAIGFTDDDIAEFTRAPDGTLKPIGCVADTSVSGTCSENATGLVAPRAIAISSDGQYLYVAAGSGNNGDVAEFQINADGSLSQLSDHDCIAENAVPGCADIGGHGLEFPNDLAISPDGHDIYVADQVAHAVTTLTRAADGSLSEPDGGADCIQDGDQTSSSECSISGPGLSQVTAVAVSPDGDNVYTAGAPNLNQNGSIAEFAREANGMLMQLTGSNNCLGTPEAGESCGGGTGTGVVGVIGLVVSPDGNNVYAASQSEGGPIAEFSRGTGGALEQLNPPNDCIQEQNDEFGCGSTGTGIGSGFELVVSPDGANVYAAAPSEFCGANSCSDVAEFTRNADGSLTQLPTPDSCIQDSSAEGSECPGNENGSGLGGIGVAISPDGGNVYVTGTDGIAEFARTLPTLAVSLQGTGTGAVSDGTDQISCPSTCSHAYGVNGQVTLTATQTPGRPSPAGAVRVQAPARAKW